MNSKNWTFTYRLTFYLCFFFPTAFGSPPLATDQFTSACGYIVNPIELLPVESQSPPLPAYYSSPTTALLPPGIPPSAFNPPPSSPQVDSTKPPPSIVQPTLPPKRPPTVPPTLPLTLPPMVPPTAPPNLPRNLPPTVPPTLPPTLPPTMPPSAPPSFPPKLPPNSPPNVSPKLPPTVPPTLPPTLPPKVPPTVPPSLPPTLSPTKPPSAPPNLPPKLPPTVPPTLPLTIPPNVPPTALPNLPPKLPPTVPPTLPPTLPPTMPPSAPPNLPPKLPPNAPPKLPPTAPLTLPPTLPPKLPPTVPPSLPPTLSPTMPPSTPPNLPPKLPPTVPPTLPPTLPPKLPPTVPTSLPPTLPPKLPSPTFPSPQGQPASLASRSLLSVQSTAPQFWSNTATWPDGIVPGVGSATGANATIPCGKFVVLDVPNITVGLLRIQGLLQFLDDPIVPLIYVKANFVLVEGQLFIGTATQQYRQKAIIELTPNTAYNRAVLKYFGPNPPADPANPRTLGHKAFAVVGGQVRLHGLPGPSSMPVWVRLGVDAKAGNNFIQVAADLSNNWPAGAQIVVTSSDRDRAQTETFNIVKVSSTGTGQSTITLSQPLSHDHYGTYNGLSDGFGGYVDQRAEVMLISRNIKITGTDEPPPHELEGGHFIIFMTPDPPSFIEGVEFYKMGQQGQLGRYSLHLHILGVSPQTVIRKNAIHQSKQRCIVNHASHNITFDSNVAYNTSGHCFMLEEGGEQNNTWINNIGVLTNPVSVPISNNETDLSASTFWITNLQNTFIGNVAAGATFSGFWFELRYFVRGNSLDIPNLMNVRPRYGTLVLFYNNTAHSCANAGLRTYPHGMSPAVSYNQYGALNILDFFNSYKNGHYGMFIHFTNNLLVRNSQFADNGFSVRMDRNTAIEFRNTTFVGETNNGTVPPCTNPNGATLGVVMDQLDFNYYMPYTFNYVRFFNFNASCQRSAGLTMVGPRFVWNAACSLQGIQTKNAIPIWTPPRISKFGGPPVDNGEQAMFTMMYDKDGSLNGGTPAYILPNTTQILPVGLPGCTYHKDWNAYACSNTCYRTLYISFAEPGFGPNAANYNFVHGQFSSLIVTRVANGQNMTLDGNLQDAIDRTGERGFAMNLLADQVYQIRFVPPVASPTFMPSTLTIELSDIGECGRGLTLQMAQVPNRPWKISPDDYVNPQLCSGTQTPSENTSLAQYSPVCINNTQWLEISISGGFNNVPKYLTRPKIVLNLGNSSDIGPCVNGSGCGISMTGQKWLYDASGLERRPSFYNPILSQPSYWIAGKAPLGNILYSNDVDTLIIPDNKTTIVTYYFRQTFNLSHSPCYTSLLVDIVVNDGVVLYINNVEVLRLNLLPGYLDNKTTALSRNSFVTWNSLTIPVNSSSPFSLVDGVNTIAAEVHSTRPGSNMAFDLRLSGQKILGCTLPQVPKPEVCDGLDNNLDGIIDNSPSGGPLTTLCSTVCGSGIMICNNGYYQNCTAVVPSLEICDGVDNDCDGLIDNGDNQLNCATGNVCWKGSCVPIINATVPVQIWPRNATGWSYNDKAVDLGSNWMIGGVNLSWPTGQGPLGFDLRTPKLPWQIINTPISVFYSKQPCMTAYFAKSFTLSQSALANTFNIDFSVRRVDGVVVYLNGVELWRSNMNWGPVLYNTTSASSIDNQQNEMPFWNCLNCRRNNSALLKIGTNVISVELHVATRSKHTGAFDMNLYQNSIAQCPPGTPTCVRQVTLPILSAGSVWRYSDGSLPVPQMTTWMSTRFSDSAWLSGVAPLGFNINGLSTVVNGSVAGAPVTTIYFRKWLNISDASCYVALSTSLKGKDGIIFYINGVEASRVNMPLVPWVNSTSLATGSSSVFLPARNLTGGWLTPGMNLFAAEVHLKPGSTSLVFDASITGVRDGVSCSPDLVNAIIPWMNG